MLKLYQTLWWILYPLLMLLAVFNIPRKWHLKKRLGFYPIPRRKQSIWYHCASLGEAKGLLGILRSLDTPEHHILITSATSQGERFLSKSLTAFPLKTSWSVHLAPIDHTLSLNNWTLKNNIQCLILYEHEIWFTVIAMYHKLNIPVFLVSGRYTWEAKKKYRFILPLVKETFQKLSWVQAQNTTEQSHFETILKNPASPGFDFKLAYLLKKAQGDLSKIHGDGFAFISLHREELDLLLPVIMNISEQVPVFIFPRYMDDIPYFHSKLKVLGSVKWSEAKGDPSEETILLIDSMGQIIKQAKYYNMCFVGGSFIKHGGHNVWEPFLEGVKIMIGPHHYNQEYSVNLLKSAKLLEVVEKPEDILSVTYEPYNLEASLAITRDLEKSYQIAISQILEKLKPVVNKISLQTLID